MKSPIGNPVFLAAVYLAVRLYLCTLRLKVVNEQSWIRHLTAGGRVLLCTWHQQFFAAIGHFRHYRRFQPAIMISRSRDGGIVASVAKRVGWVVVRGSSSSGGRAALTQLIARLDRQPLAAHILDGPKGPAGTVKPGVIRLAQAGRAATVPFTVRADRAWYFNSWDRFMLPKPFARVELRFGELIPPLPPDAGTGFETRRRYLEALMRPALVPRQRKASPP
jgi:lysophospholipid acyltransferase (LPLAT)-like uncharacterized protein